MSIAEIVVVFAGGLVIGGLIGEAMRWVAILFCKAMEAYYTFRANREEQKYDQPPRH